MINPPNAPTINSSTKHQALDKIQRRLMQGQEKKDYEFIHIANQVMTNEFFILNHKRKKLIGWFNT